MKHPLLLCSALLMVVAGLFALAKAPQIQNWARRFANWPFQDYVESPSYVLHTRIWGVLVIAVAFCLAYVAISTS